MSLASARSLLARAIVALALWATGGPAAAAELTEEQENDAIVFAWDNAVFTLYHELGHMFVDQYSLPVLAREEDAVDNLATLMAMDDFNRDEDSVLFNAAQGWFMSAAAKGDAAFDASDFYDEHSLDKQRTYAMLCLMVGSDKEKFGALATDAGMPDRRQDRCAGDYGQAKRSWDAVLAPYATPNEGEPKITVVYTEPSEATEDGRDILRTNEVLEIVARKIEAGYTLPNPITIEGADCGQENAFYDPSQAKLTVCYELVKNYYDLFVADLRKNGTTDAAEDDAIAEAVPEDTTARAASRFVISKTVSPEATDDDESGEEDGDAE